MKLTKNPNQIFTGTYSIWLFMNLYWLFKSLDIKGRKEILYPFYGEFDSEYHPFIEVYDFTEFIVYGLGPLFIWISIKNLIEKK